MHLDQYTHEKNNIKDIYELFRSAFTYQTEHFFYQVWKIISLSLGTLQLKETLNRDWQ